MKQHNQAIFKRHDGFQSLLPMFEEVAHPLFENNVEEGGEVDPWIYLQTLPKILIGDLYVSAEGMEHSFKIYTTR